MGSGSSHTKVEIYVTRTCTPLHSRSLCPKGSSNPEIVEWLESVRRNVGHLGPLDPEPYWGLNDLRYEIGAKIKNCFYVIAETKVESKHEFFRYNTLLVLSGFSFDNFLGCIEQGVVLVDFDARTGHNHGTKFRIRQNHWQDLYDQVERIPLT